MGIMDFLHSRSDLKTKKHDRQLHANESAAKVAHLAAETARIASQPNLEARRLDHEIQQWHVKTRYEAAILAEQVDTLREARAAGADINFHGLQIRYRRAPALEEGKPQEQEVPLPGRIDFIEILQSWRPSQQQIFLGLAPGGGFVTVPLPALCHVALAGSTGVGKSNLMRLLLSQLLFVGAHVVICDPHYTPFDAESGEDWQPIERRLAIEPAVSPGEINNVLRWAAVDALPKRLELRRSKQKVGKPIFIAMDELPAIVAKVPDAPNYMGEIGREGRKVGIYLISSAQDFLVKTIGGTGAARDNFRTAIYSGGDATTARALLDVKGNPDNGSLGKGIVLARSQAQPVAALMRVPYASNESLYRLLGSVPGRSSEQEHFSGFQERREQPLMLDGPVIDAVPVQSSNERKSIPRGEREQIIRLAKAGVSRRDMCQALGKGKHYYEIVKRVLDQEGL